MVYHTLHQLSGTSLLANGEWRMANGEWDGAWEEREGEWMGERTNGRLIRKMCPGVDGRF